jgi:hypothetical protein
LGQRPILNGGIFMATLGSFFAELWWPLNFLVMAVFLGIVWLLIRPFKRLRPFTGQLLVLAGIFWVGLLFFIISFSFPPPAPILRAVTDASTIPRVWFLAMVPVIVIALIPILRGKEDPDPKWGNLRLVFTILGALVLSVGLFEIIGYYISSALFIFAVMWVLGVRKKLELIAVQAGWVLFSYFVFARLLNVRLPIGIIFSGLFG